MTTKKKTICLVTNWYPSKDNPYLGLFFKEQAFALSSEYDFVVVHYLESTGMLFARCKTMIVNEEHNTIEYRISVKVPFLLQVYNQIYGMLITRLSKLRMEGVGAYTSNKKAKFTQKYLCNAFSSNISNEVDAFYCVDAQTESFWLKCLSNKYNKPYMISEHAPVPWPGSVLSNLNKDAIENADVFLAISMDKIRQIMMQNLKLPYIQYIGNLIDEDQFQLSPSKDNNHIKTLLIVASNSYYKNYEMFIQVMERLTAIISVPFKVLIVGYSANKGYSKNAAELEKRVLNSVISNITEMVSEVPHDRLNEIYHKADAFVMTSIQEGQPVSALEAACCGLPIFSTRCGGVEDYVDETIGRIYSITDVEGMAQGLKAFLDGKLHFNSVHIRRTIVNQFGKKAFVSHFNQAFAVATKHDN